MMFLLFLATNYSWIQNLILLKMLEMLEPTGVPQEPIDSSNLFAVGLCFRQSCLPAACGNPQRNRWLPESSDCHGPMDPTRNKPWNKPWKCDGPGCPRLGSCCGSRCCGSLGVRTCWPRSYCSEWNLLNCRILCRILGCPRLRWFPGAFSTKSFPVQCSLWTSRSKTSRRAKWRTRWAPLRHIFFRVSQNFLVHLVNSVKFHYRTMPHSLLYAFIIL